MAFTTAARIAFKKLVDASPVLLEPIYSVKVYVPDEYMGDIIGDMKQAPRPHHGHGPGPTACSACPPRCRWAKCSSTPTDLRSMTQARGSFTMQFERYEEVPAAGLRQEDHRKTPSARRKRRSNIPLFRRATAARDMSFASASARRGAGLYSWERTMEREILLLGDARLYQVCNPVRRGRTCGDAGAHRRHARYHTRLPAENGRGAGHRRAADRRDEARGVHVP